MNKIHVFIYFPFYVAEKWEMVQHACPDCLENTPPPTGEWGGFQGGRGQESGPAAVWEESLKQ